MLKPAADEHGGMMTTTTSRRAAAEPDRDATARLSLRRYRRFATGLLVGMAALTLAGYALGRGFWPGLLQSTAKAGLIGGLATGLP